MRTRLETAVAALVESSWLLALIVVPVFFNASSQRVFDEDKIPLLRSLTLIIVAACLVWGVDEGWAAAYTSCRRVWRAPVVKPALALIAVYLAATTWSIAPRISWLGAYQRGQGTYTWCSYAIVFGALVGFVRQRRQVERAITAAMLASVPPLLYAIVQHGGNDPIAWDFAVAERVIGTLGNPIFFSGFIIMVVPLTLVRWVNESARVLADHRSHRAAGARAALYFALLVLQVLGIAYSKSRGPLVGLLAGLTLWVVLLALNRRWHWLGLTLAGAVLAAGASVLIVNSPVPSALAFAPPPMAQPPAADEEDVPMSRMVDFSSNSTRVRILIWQSISELLASDRLRALIGHGPETLFLAFGPVYPADLVDYQKETSPDRAHNETFQALVETGAVGCLAELVLFVGGCAYGFRRLGHLATPGERARLAAAAIVGGIAGGLSPYLITGNFSFFGLGVPAGVTLGLAAALVAGAKRKPVAPPGSDELLLVGLLAAIVADFVEIQFGIPTTSTRLYYWVYLALIVAIGTRGESPQWVESEASDQLPVTERSQFGLLIGLMLALMLFNFYSPAVPIAGNAAAPLLLAIWLGCVLLAAAEAKDAPSARGILSLLVSSLTVSLLFALLREWCDPKLPASGGAGLAERAMTDAANAIGLCYLAVLLCALWPTFVAVKRDWRRGGTLARHPGRVALFGLPLLCLLTFIVVRSNFDVARADIFSKQAVIADQSGNGAAAFFGYSEAVRLQPVQDFYATDLGHFLLIVAARTPPDAARRRDDYLARARAELERAQTLNPLHPDHPRNLARLHRQWASMTSDPDEHALHAALANRLYAKAVELAPHNAAVLNEWAGLYVDLNEPQPALAVLKQALAIGKHATVAYALRAQAELELDQPERALADSERALALNRNLLSAARAKAQALARLGGLEPAIAAQQRAVLGHPQDPNHHRDLALLYQLDGRRDLAFAEAQAALARADHREAAQLRSLVEELRASVKQ
ncbi:MAG TPA: O-antigen ligase family protein [Candidatus Kryptonia bacterium]|nr:O-antigen ligase family protein [Candidatus Kryptonia bacterium]